MSYQEFDASGKLRLWHDDETRKVRRFDEQGQEILPAGDYTDEQNAAADAEAAAEAARQAYETRRAAVKLIVNDLQTEKTRYQTIIDKPNNQITAADTKDAARAGKRVADAAIDLARLLTD